MAKKKNKMNEQARIQMEQARYRKMYYEKLQYLCDTYGGKGTYALIPPKYLEGLFLYRIQPIKVLPDSNGKLNTKTHKYIHKLLYHVMHCMSIKIDGQLPDIELDDFFVYGQSMRALSYIIRDHPEVLWAVEFSKRLELFLHEDVFRRAIDEIFDLMSNVGTMLSNIQNDIVWLEIEFGENAAGNMQNIARLYIHKPTIKYFVFPEGSRPAFRVTWSLQSVGIKEYSIKSSEWDSSSIFSDLPLEVYIQSHALQRLWERIDVYTFYLVQLSMLISILNPVIVRTGKNTGLIEYKINGHKYGYLVCEYINGDILIKTFLFLTNNGTPEGQKLNELSGLNKDDKKYLAIDRISSFIASDIEKNESLKKLFIESGCESLLHAAEHLNFEKERLRAYDSTALIAEYIKQEPIPVLEKVF